MWFWFESIIFILIFLFIAKKIISFYIFYISKFHSFSYSQSDLSNFLRVTDDITDNLRRIKGRLLCLW